MITLLSLACINTSINSGRSYSVVNSGDLAVDNCFFSRISNLNGDGGVIYLYGGDFLNVTNVMFSSCSATYGGAVYSISNKVTNFVRICAFKCNASSGHFYQNLYVDETKIDYLSVNHCGNYSYGQGSLRLANTKVVHQNSNHSLNKNSMNSAIHYYFPSSLSCLYCNFCNNHASDTVVIMFQSGSGTRKMEYSNIVGNTQGQLYGDGIIKVGNTGEYQMISCVFSENNAVLFSIYADTLTLSKCWVNHQSSISKSRLTQIQVSLGVTYQISMLQFYSYFCKADTPKPSFTHVPTITQTQMMTKQPTQKRSPFITPQLTHGRTPFQSPKNTPNRSPPNTPHPTISQSIPHTMPFNSIKLDIYIYFSFLYL